MKNTIAIFIMLLVILTASIFVNDVVANTNPFQKDSLIISTSSHLYPLVNKWVNEYDRINPEANIKLAFQDEEAIQNTFSTNANISFVSSPDFSSLDPTSLWKMAVGRDVIVPVFNSDNPLRNLIDVQGISPQALRHLFTNQGNQQWGVLLKKNQSIPVNYYLIDDESVNSIVMDFLNISTKTLKGITLNNSEELLSAIQNDPNAIGFCKLTDILNENQQSFVKNIMPLPLDRNGNGEIDYQENIYDDVYNLSRGIWIGKYPKSLSSNIYTISSSQPSEEVEVDFLKWVLTDGQKFLKGSGYCDLILSERHSKLTKFNNQELIVENPKNQYASQKIILLIIVLAIAMGFVVSGIVRYRRRKKEDFLDMGYSTDSILNENTVLTPNGLYFDKSHTWAFMEKDGTVKVGIDDFLQHATGPITRTILKKPGDSIKKGELLITLVQDGKQLNIYAPVSGAIKDSNEILITEPSMINSSPYNEGWVYMIEPSNWLREIQFLKMAENYKGWLENEFTRLKDFLANSINAKNLDYAEVAYQDGGELKDNVLQDFGPELWEDFQKHFIDNSQLR